MSIDKELVKSKIHSKEDISLKTITDIVAYNISESPENMGPESNFLAAIEAVSQYISENFKDIDTFKTRLSQHDKGPELNFISAETFVAQYISENFKNIREFRRCLTDLGKGSYALESFADLVYKYYCQKIP